MGSIELGAESVLAEVNEAPEAHGLTQEQANAIAALPPEQIESAIRESADDWFWEAYNSVRRSAIARLAKQIG